MFKQLTPLIYRVTVYDSIASKDIIVGYLQKQLDGEDAGYWMFYTEPIKVPMSAGTLGIISKKLFSLNKE